VLVVGYIGITYVECKAELSVLQALDHAHLLQSGFVAVVDDKTVHTSPDALLWGGWGSGSGPVQQQTRRDALLRPVSARFLRAPPIYEVAYSHGFKNIPHSKRDTAFLATTTRHQGNT